MTSEVVQDVDSAPTDSVAKRGVLEVAKATTIDLGTEKDVLQAGC